MNHCNFLLLACQMILIDLTIAEGIQLSDLVPKKEIIELDEKDPNTEFIKQLELPFNIVYILVGLPLMVLGFRYLKLAITVVGLVGGNLASFMILTLAWPEWPMEGHAIVIGVLCGCALTGCWLAIFQWVFPKFAKIFKGMVTGAIFGMQFYGILIGIIGVSFFFIKKRNHCLLYTCLL